MAKRIQLRRTKGWRKPEGAVVVTRATKWGNPFAHAVPPGHKRALLCYLPTMTPILALGCFQVVTSDKETQRQNAVEAFAAWLDGPTPEAAAIRRSAPLELRGKDLACFCPLHRDGEYVPCHADVLLSIANGIPMEEVIRENIRWAEGKAV